MKTHYINIASGKWGNLKLTIFLILATGLLNAIYVYRKEKFDFNLRLVNTYLVIIAFYAANRKWRLKMCKTQKGRLGATCYKLKNRQEKPVRGEGRESMAPNLKH